jgi:3-deoxy-manno-octulosonate cytidylyltransferase (CMP-KDO synthetase)
MAARIIGVIPARMEATRLPGKPLRIIAGHPMLAWVYHRARQAKSLDRLVVATDSEEIRAYCAGHEIPVTMTSRQHRSGTDRIIEVMGREPAELYVNIQGDEPLVNGGHVELTLRPFAESSEAPVATLKVAMNAREAIDPNIVKVVTDLRGIALYFSRAAIPFDRDGTGHVQHYKHLGVYAYTRAALQRFSALAPSPLELAERLEQLRFLENGIRIAVVETQEDTIGVDTEEDLKRVEEILIRAGAQLPLR